VPDILDDLRVDLDAAFARAETAKQRRRRWALPLGTLTVGAAATIAAIALTTGSPATATAAEALRAVADVAQHAPARVPRDDQYYYVRSRGTNLSMFAGVDPQHEHAASLVESEREIWLSVDRPGRLITRRIAAHPLTPADAGRTQGPESPSGVQPIGATRGYTIGGEHLTRAQLLAFPTDPQAVYDRIRAHVGDGGHSVEGQLFEAHPPRVDLRPADVRTARRPRRPGRPRTR
jgi:hypothetical protein